MRKVLARGAVIAAGVILLIAFGFAMGLDVYAQIEPIPLPYAFPAHAPLARWLDANSAGAVVWLEANLTDAQKRALWAEAFPPITDTRELDMLRDLRNRAGGVLAENNAILVAIKARIAVLEPVIEPVEREE